MSLDRFVFVASLVAWLYVTLLLSPMSAAAQDMLSLSPDITLTQGATVVADQDVVLDNQLGITVLENLGPIPAPNDVTGHAADANGDRLFALANAASLAGGVYVRPGDVVRYDGANYTLEFDASAEGVPMGVKTDAVGVAPGGGLLLSFDGTVNLGGTVAADEDLVRWDGAVFVLAFDGSDAGLSTALDVDAAQDLGGGAVLVSLDTAGSVGGVAFSDEDVLRYDGATWSLELDTSTTDSEWIAADLDAMVVPEPGWMIGLATGALAIVPLRRARRA